MPIPIDFLYWPECPSHPEAWVLLERIVAEMDAPVAIEKRVIETEAEAEAEHFPGSPTIRVKGRDVDPKSGEDMPARLTCRLYFREDGRPSAIPTASMIRNALELAIKEQNP